VPPAGKPATRSDRDCQLPEMAGPADELISRKSSLLSDVIQWPSSSGEDHQQDTRYRADTERDHLLCMYHPAAALHQGNLRQTIKQDILKLPPLLAQAKVLK